LTIDRSNRWQPSLLLDTTATLGRENCRVEDDMLFDGHAIIQAKAVYATIGAPLPV
jgi:hypothetical protein